MFFGKSERKRSSVVPILIVGALAFVGAVSLTKKGKAVICNAAGKVKRIVTREDSGSMCDM